MEKQEDQTSKKPDSEKWIVKDIYDHIKERMSGSFLPAFIISFIAVNWQFFYITFFVSEQYIDKMKVNWLSINKIQYIYEMYDRLYWRDYSWYVFFWPFFWVLLYYFAIPFFDELIKITKYRLSIEYFPNKIKWWFRGGDYNNTEWYMYWLSEIIYNFWGYMYWNHFSNDSIKKVLLKLSSEDIIIIKHHKLYNNKDSSGYDYNNTIEIKLTEKWKYIMKRYFMENTK